MKQLTALALALAVAGTQLGVAHADRMEDARKHFLAGKAAHDAARYDEAIKEYQAAFDLAPLPELLFNLGQVYRLKGEKQKALDHYAKYLVVAPNGPVAADARKYSALLEKQLADEAAAKPDPTPTPTPTPQPPPQLEPRPVQPQPQPVQQQPQPVDRGSPPGRGMKIAAYVVGGVGILSAAAAVKFGLDARAASADLDKVSDGSWDQADIDRIDEGERAETFAFVATGVAVAAIGTSAVLYVLGSRAESTSVALVPRDGGGVFAVSGRF